MNNKLKIGIYCRISSESQSNNTSIQNQKDLGVRFCEDNNYDYEIYSETISGGEVSRKEFDKLSNKLLSKELQGIYLTNWDRMVREKRVMIVFEDLVKESNCKVFVDGIERNIINNEGDILDFEFRGMLSSMERRNIRRRMSYGVKTKLEKGEIIVGMYGIGYKKINGKIEINTQEAELIKTLYKTFLRKDVKSFSNLLSRMETIYQTRGGLDKRINSSSVRRLLSNENFCGYKKIKFTENGIISKYDIKIGEIIDIELFGEVKCKLESLKNNNTRNKKGDYLLDKKVFCKGCGERMWIHSVKSKKYSYYYFTCFTNSKRNSRYGGVKKLKRLELGDDFKCKYQDGNDIDLKELEKIIWEYLFQILKNTTYLKAEYERKFESNNIKLKDNTNKIKYYNIKKTELSKKKEKVLRLYIDDKLSENDKIISLKSINDEISTIETNILELQDDNISKEDKEVVLTYLDYLNLTLEQDYNLTRFKDKKRYIDKYIEEVEVEFLKKDEKKVKNYNVYISVKFNLDDEDILNIAEEKYKLKSNYNFYVLQSKTLKSCKTIHKKFITLKITINTSLRSRNTINSKILEVKMV